MLMAMKLIYHQQAEAIITYPLDLQRMGKPEWSHRLAIRAVVVMHMDSIVS